MTYLPRFGDGATKKVTLIPGDGIGPEVTASVVRVVDALGAPICWERFDSLSGSMPDGTPRSVVPKEVLESIKRNGVCLKGTLFTEARLVLFLGGAPPAGRPLLPPPPPPHAAAAAGRCCCRPLRAAPPP